MIATHASLSCVCADYAAPRDTPLPGRCRLAVRRPNTAVPVALAQPRKRRTSVQMTSGPNLQKHGHSNPRKLCREASDSLGRQAAVVVDRATSRESQEHASPEEASSVLGVSRPPAHLGPISERRMKLAVDIDEVLGRFVESLNNYYYATFDEQYEISDFHEYCFRKVWNCTQDESNDIVHAFFESQHFSEGIQPIPGAYDALIQLSDHVDLEIVTSRQNAIQDETITWVETHFPGVFQDIHFGNHWAKNGKSVPKSQICKRIGASCLIDDNPVYAVECAEQGINVLLYDWNFSYPWSKTKEGPTHVKIQRVKSWDHAAASVMSMVERGEWN